MKKWKSIRKFLYSLYGILITFPVWADLPTPPPEDQVSGSKDWLDVAASIIYRGGKYILIILGFVILGAAAANTIRAYNKAHDKEDLGHFFKHLIVGLVAVVFGLGLVYAGYSIIPSE